MQLLIVEDEDDFRESSLHWMRRKGHIAFAAPSGAEALQLCARHHFDVAIVDMNMPGMSGIELLQRIGQEGIEVEVVILTGQGSIESAVQAMKLGACDYLEKPCPLGEIEHRCLLASERARLKRENAQLKSLISRSNRRAEIVGQSVGMQEVKKLISRIAPTDKPVLITGESGTGKEVIARAIQSASPLADKPFVTINCAALPETLVESELFGHQKGAFTGATSDQPGLFEVADGGTIFIDELGEMPLSLQPKLLRVLEDGSMRRIGSHRELRVKVRLITATNRDLAERVQAGAFREDLYYRVNVLPIHLPPLRDRVGDVDLLLEHFLPGGWTINAEARAAMNAYAWPGNIRELINVIQRGTILADGNEISADDLPRELLHEFDRPVFDEPGGLADSAMRVSGALRGSEASLDEVARAHVLEVLDQHSGNKAQTARALGIHRRKLYRLLERFSTD